MKTVIEAGFPSLAFFEMVAQIKPSADHVLVSLGGEDGRLEWRPYVGGISGTTTYDLSGITITSQIINAEEVDLLVVQAGVLVPVTFTCTGVLLTYSSGGTDFKSFSGLATAAGFGLIESIWQSINGANKESVYTTIQTDGRTFKAITTDNNATLKVYAYTLSSQEQISYISYLSGVLDTSQTITFSPEDTSGENIKLTDINGDIHYYSSYQYLEVNVTSAQLLDIDNNNVLLLPTLPTGKYYTLQKMIFEFTQGTVTYTWAGDYFVINSPAGAEFYITPSLINSGASQAAIITNFQGDLDVVESLVINKSVNVDGSNSEISMFSYNGTAPTLGNGTMKVKIWYRIETFG